MAKILVIDDDRIMLDALAAFLGRAGHEVLTAADGANGVQAFKNALPDLVVLDRDLPVMSGSGVFDYIRKISKATPILILSGYNDPEEVGAYLRSGAAAFLSKGDGLSPVLAEIDRLLGVRRKEGPLAAKAEQAATPQARTAPGRSAGIILVADDDPDTRRVLCRLLTSLGYEAFEAKDGLEALELARAHRPDVVLLDISMPGKNGVEVLKELAPEIPKTGFIMITGNEDVAVALDCLKFGAFDYFPKPINIEALGGIIQARLLLQK